MRTFYIFKIKPEMAILTKDSPYNLFKSMEKIYKMDKSDFSLGAQLFDQLAQPINSQKLNKLIYNKYKDNEHYTVFKNIHRINNSYRQEKSKLIVKEVYLILQSSVILPLFLKTLNNNHNMFACDFENKDYFWLDELTS